MDAIKQMEEFYKKLLEEEIKDICDKVLDEIIVRYAFDRYVPTDAFIEECKSYIEKKNIPVDLSVINEYIESIIKERGLREIKGGNIYKRISEKWNNVCFNKFSQIVKSENEERTRIIYCLKNFFLFYKLRKVTLYTEFSELKKIFEYMGMSLSGQLSVLIETIKLNYSCYNNPDFVVYIPDNEAILNHKFKNIKQSEIAEMIANYKLEEFLANEDPKLEAAQDELLEFMESTSIDVTGVQEASLSLGTIITNEKITPEDEEVIMVCLQKLSFEHLYYRFIKQLNNKGESSVNDKVEVISPKKVSSKKEPKFKKRKINQVHYEINKLYDLENFKSRMILSLDEIIYILSLMYSIEMDENIISQFLSSVSHEYHKNNPFAIYYQSKEKYKTSDNEEVSEHLEMIEYILSDFDIFSCSDEEYTEVKSMISEEITAIMQILEGNYTYEIDKAKMLLKEKGRNSMEQAIKELEKHLKRLLEEQEKDIYIEAVCQYMGITMEEVKRRAITAQEQGNQNGNRIADNIITELKKNPDAFIGMSEIEKLKLFTKCEDLIKEEKPTRTKMIHYLSSFLNYLGLEEHQTFLELDKLSEIFQYINLSISNQITILANIIRVNSQLDIRDESSRVYLPNTSVLLEHQYQYMDGNELFEILVNNRFDEFLEDENYPNKAAQKEVEEMFERTKIDYTDIQDACNALDKIFIKDAKDVTEEEYQTIIEKMEQISFGHIAHRVVKKIKKEQENDINQNIKASTQTTEKSFQPSPKKEPKFKQRKINQVHYEINKLYDLENFKSRTTLSLDEIIYILSLMYSIEMDENIIARFLSSVSREYHKNSPFAIYYQSKEKYEASDNEEVSEHLEMIEYILSDFDIFSCSDEKYTEVKSMISEEITAIRQILEGNYDYEIDRAKSLMKMNEGEKDGCNN